MALGWFLVMMKKRSRRYLNREIRAILRSRRNDDLVDLAFLSGDGRYHQIT